MAQRYITANLGSRNYQMTSQFVSRQLRFNSIDSHRPDPTQDFDFITKLTVIKLLIC